MPHVATPAASIQQAALEMIACGLSVIPAKDKRPSLSWKAYQKTIMPPAFAVQAFATAPQIALICGAVSGGLEVIDIDLKYDVSGTLYSRFRELVETADPDFYYDLVVQKTQGNGIHLAYRCETIAGNQKLAARPTTGEEKQDTYARELEAQTKAGKTSDEAAALARKASATDKTRVLIETRGEGGYIIAAPSEGYRLLTAHGWDEIPTITPHQRDILLSAARSLNEYAPEVAAPAGPSPEASGWDLSPGDDFDQRGDVVSLLESHGWRVVGRQGETVRFLRPGETTSAYSANYNQIPGRFWCWSTSTQFVPETVYKPYAVFALLECRGDFKEAAKKLLGMGYGKSKPMPTPARTQPAATSPETAEGVSDGEKAVYMRVGTNYFKKISIRDMHGNEIEKIVRWSKEEIVLDHGKKMLHVIPKYDSFVVRPDHINYRHVVGNSYNLYTKISHELVEGPHPHITGFLRHIFGEKETLFLDYLTILWQKPTQVLPIICLVSEQRQTGKTTVFELLRAIFQSNAVILKNENFQTQFNSHYVGKLLIMIDENYVELDKKKESERIKSMATAKTEWLQFKGKDSEQVDFFGKIMMTANNKEFIKIDKEEIRYMVVEVNTFEKNDPDLLDKMVAEIPAFLCTLHTRTPHYPREDRAWFRPELLYTDTLTEVVKNTRSKKEQLIDDFIEQCINAFCVESREEIFMSATDIHRELFTLNKSVDRVDIMRRLKSLGYQPQKQQAYQFYSLAKYEEGAEPGYCVFGKNGTPYVFSKSKKP